jgi:hypothetical protein
MNDEYIYTRTHTCHSLVLFVFGQPGGVVLVANPAVFLNRPPAELASRFLLPQDLSLELMDGLGGTLRYALSLPFSTQPCLRFALSARFPFLLL